MMTGKTPNSVSLKTLPKALQIALKAAKNGGDSVAIRDDAEIIGYFVPCEVYKAEFDAAVSKLLSSRMKGPTISHKEVQAQVRRYVKRLQAAQEDLLKIAD
jgi:hypothetical protein